jgi:hypothetical protein
MIFTLKRNLGRSRILADEVGLGKTIEASLVLAELRRERRRHCAHSACVAEAPARPDGVKGRKRFLMMAAIMPVRTACRACGHGAKRSIIKP